MSKLEELIQKYCPDGVEYKPIGDYLKYEQPTKYLVESTKYDDSYPTPVLTAGQSFILGYTKETDGIYKASKDSPVIIFDDFTTSLHWVEFSFKVKSSAMKMLTPVDETKALFRYLYYCMKNIMYVPGDHTRQWIGTYSQFEIPIPPLPVQEEIVRVLDTFTELQAELQAELQKRLQQYNYYRDKLLTFDGREDVEWKMLGEVCDFKNGFAFKSDLFREEGLPIVRITNITESGVIMKDVKYFHLEDYPKTKMSSFAIKNGDILVAMSGGTTGKIGTFKGSGTAYLNQRAGKFVPGPKIINRFLYHFLLTQVNEIYKMAGGGAQPNLSSNDLKSKIIVPVPSLKEQERIASILDRFDALTTDLSQGLPAEIEKRRQQYEFYRDKLLTFKRKEA